MKVKRFAKTYTLATQGIFSMALYTVLGFVIGYIIDKDSVWPPILAVVGLLFGLFSFVTYLLWLLKEDEKERKNNQKFIEGEEDGPREEK